MAYKRKFIILKKDYGTISGNPKGHSKLEMKGVRGNLTLNIENAEKETYYNVILVGNNRKTISWNLGKVFTDEYGKGKGEYIIIPRELESMDFPLDKLTGVVILRGAEVLLGGYLNKDDSSIESYISSLDMIKPEGRHEKIQEEIQIEESELPSENQELKLYEQEVQEEVYEETNLDVNQETENKAEGKIIETYEEEQEPKTYEYDNEISKTSGYNDDMEVKEFSTEDNKGIEVDNNDLEINKELDKKPLGENELNNLEHIKKINQKNQTTMYVLSILRFFPYIEPFENNLKGFNWWIVETDKENEYRSFLPYFSYITGGNKKDLYNEGITCNQLIEKYKHYLFGLFNEDEKVKYYVYGLPGKFTREEHPNMGINGFNTWFKGKDLDGYWILYIDPMTGKPVYPHVPMIPAKN